LRVCLFAPAFPPKVGGGESLVATVTEELCARGVTICALTAAPPSPDIVERIEGSGGVVVVPGPSRPGRLRWEHEGFYKSEVLYQLIKEKDIELVHAFSYDTAIAAAVVLPRHDRDRVPLVGTFSEMTVDERVATEHLRAGYVFRLQELDVYMALSDLYAQMALDHGLPPEKLYLNKVGIDVRRFAAGSRRRGRAWLGLPDEVLLVTCPSRFARRKGQLDLLQALEILAPRQLDLQVVLAGSINSAYQDELEAIEARVARQRLRRPILVLRDVDWRAMPDLLAASDLVVLPSHYEGLSRAALEAMAAGACPLLTDTAGFKELASHGSTAYFVPPRSPEDLAQGMAELLTNPVLRQRIASAARIHVKKWFSITSTVDRMLSLYRSLVEADRRPASQNTTVG
jgi:glycosyltransferase involved in cell wall biosynthesis